MENTFLILFSGLVLFFSIVFAGAVLFLGWRAWQRHKTRHAMNQAGAFYTGVIGGLFLAAFLETRKKNLHDKKGEKEATK